MSGIAVLAFSVVWLVFCYLFYGRRRIKKRLADPLDEGPTPAHALTDGADFHPAPRLILFGHHFSSIAGVGPIVGPIIAVAAFGWGPALLWLVLGGVFIGAVHDFLALVISARNRGESLPETAKRVVSPRARVLFLAFVWLMIMLVVAVFAAFAARAMVDLPELVLPTFLLIPLAVGFGVVQKRKLLPLPVSTLAAILGLGGLVYLGLKVPVVLPFGGETAYLVWFSCLMVYAFAASVTPVWVLLQPRDYISSWVLFLGVGLASVGIVVAAPAMSAPVFTGFVSQTEGPLIPFLFIIVACGAVSGFHSVVAGGTTSKQLDREADALPVGYGAMLTETVVGVIALVIAGGVVAWTGAGNLREMLASGTPLGVFGEGFGRLTGFIFGTKLGTLVGVTVVNVFIMTTLDTAVRLSRFLTGELAGGFTLKLKKNKFLLTLIPVVPAFLLGATGEWRAVWPVFGSANQLVAALGLIVITAYLYATGRTIRYTLWATVFMLVVTTAALGFLAWRFLVAEPNLFLGVLSAALLVLAALMVVEGLKLVKKRRTDDVV
jgi:carbon starvation protein